MHRTKITVAASLISLSAILLAWAAANPDDPRNVSGPALHVQHNPHEHQLLRAARSFDGDVRRLPFVKPAKKERPEREPPAVVPVPFQNANTGAAAPTIDTGANAVVPDVPAPSATANFDGLDYPTFSNGHPPDTNGDVGPQYFIQTVNTSVGIYRKSDGVRVAAFTFDTLMSQGQFGNLCDTDNFGDPVVLYDTFEDRWILTDFAFKLDSQGNVINPPGSFQCFAASKTSDPVNGGWNFYSINTAGGLGDYPKFGIWPDGLYMSANMFDYAASGSYQNARVYAFNKAQMYAGAPAVQSMSFDAPSAEFTLLPANARLQAGTPPSGTPNYFSVVWQFTNVISFYKFHVDWNRTALSTFSGPFSSTAPASWASAPNTVSEQSGNALDTLRTRLMMQNQYTNRGGVESLWNSHTVRGSTTSQAAIRYYQVTVSGGNVGSTTTQAATFNPSTLSRFTPSVAVDRAGDMAIGYSTSSSTSFPAIKYAGRLSSDAVNTITQTETSLINGTGSQSGSCGSTCTRWGDYSAMTLDPDGCTFWFTSEYYVTTGLNDHTRIGSFKFSQCTNVGAGGTLSGTITASVGGAPISGATVSLGTRSATTDATGTYAFAALPAGTYPALTVAAPGYNTASKNNIPVTDNAVTTQSFFLDFAPASACPADTTQSDFQTGSIANADVATTPGDVTLSRSGSTYSSSGSFVSALKDANPPTGATTTWKTLSWTAAIPANTTLRFQVAASNNANGPFNFVGPDSTANTYFNTSGTSIAQFTGNRFLQYKAYLSTTNTTATPTLHDVTVCYSNGTPKIAVEQPAGTGLTSGSSSIDFGSLDPGATASNTFTINNSGNANLSPIGVTFGGTNPQDFIVTSAPATLVMPNASTTFTVQFTPLAAGTRNAVMHIASNDPTASPFDVNLTAFTSTYSEAWRSFYFNTTDNVGDAADSSDPDNDSISNLLEFGTGTIPNQPNAMPGQVTANGANLEFRYQRSKHALYDGVLFKVEWSDDLTSLTWNTNGVSESISSEDSLFQQVKAVVPKGTGNHRFLRLRVTRP
jgi:hypothetical protein